MNYNEMKRIVETIDELKDLSFLSLEDAKKWVETWGGTVLNSNEPDFFDFDYKMLTGTFYKRDDGTIELCENLTVYDESGNPKFDVEL